MSENEARRIHQELEEALEAVQEHARVSARRTRARSAEEGAGDVVERARLKLADEEADVRKLESFSPARIWATLRGSRDTDLDREQAEQEAAQYEVARAEAWLLSCREETQRAEAELATLGDVDGRRAQALDAKEEWLRGVPGPAGEQLARVADDLADAQSECKEVREAVAAGELAAAALDRARRKLGAAGDWATYDTFFGGGMIGDAMKYSRLDEAQGLLHAADQALRHLATELADVGVNAVVKDLAISGLQQTFDVWFDNVFSDWSVRERITKAARQTQETARVVHEIRERLAVREHDLVARVTALTGERESLLADASTTPRDQ